MDEQHRQNKVALTLLVFVVVGVALFSVDGLQVLPGDLSLILVAAIWLVTIWGLLARPALTTICALLMVHLGYASALLYGPALTGQIWPGVADEQFAVVLSLTFVIGVTWIATRAFPPQENGLPAFMLIAAIMVAAFSGSTIGRFQIVMVSLGTLQVVLVHLIRVCQVRALPSAILLAATTFLVA